MTSMAVMVCVCDDSIDGGVGVWEDSIGGCEGESAKTGLMVV